MTLRSLIATDAITVFCNEDDFAEPVVYYGRSAGPRPISAVVIRLGVQLFAEDEQNAMPTYEVHVANDETLGISSTEINCGGDELEFASRDGQTATRHTIKHISSQDNGMLVLVCL